MDNIAKHKCYRSHAFNVSARSRYVFQQNTLINSHESYRLCDADCIEEAEQLREVVLSGRVHLQQVELEAEQWKEELRRLQTHNCEQTQQIQQLRQDRQNSQEHNNRSEKLCEQLRVKKAVSAHCDLIRVT